MNNFVFFGLFFGIFFVVIKTLSSSYEDKLDRRAMCKMVQRKHRARFMIRLALCNTPEEKSRLLRDSWPKANSEFQEDMRIVEKIWKIK